MRALKEGKTCQSGCVIDRFGGSEGSWRNGPPHAGQTMAGNPPGFSGGKASTIISSTHSVWSHERQRYLNHSLGSVQGSSPHPSSDVSFWFIAYLLHQVFKEVSNNTIARMFD